MYMYVHKQVMSDYLGQCVLCMHIHICTYILSDYQGLTVHKVHTHTHTHTHTQVVSDYQGLTVCLYIYTDIYCRIIKALLHL